MCSFKLIPTAESLVIFFEKSETLLSTVERMRFSVKQKAVISIAVYELCVFNSQINSESYFPN